MGKHLVFIGAGHAHLTAIEHISRFIGKGHKVTVVGPGSYHYYSGMGPGMLAGTYLPQEIRFNVKKLTETRGGQFIKDLVVQVDPQKRHIKLKSGKTVDYDVLSFNTGSEISTGPIDASYDNIFKVKPIENLFALKCKIINALKEKSVRIVVVGGGAAGIEMVNNAWRLITDQHSEKSEVTLISKGQILNRFPNKVREKALINMKSKGIKIQENIRVKGNTQEKLLLENGNELPFDFALIATGTKPSDIFRVSNIPTGDDGGLLVNGFLQSPQYPEIFGGGDCISFQPRPLDKVGVFAVRQNPILLENLTATLEDKTDSLRKFDPQNQYLLILNMGDGIGIFNRKSLTFGGKMAFKLKDWIDRRFMKTFQLANELKESLDCQSWELKS